MLSSYINIIKGDVNADGIVNNTIRLDSNESIGYIGGNDVVVGIKAVSDDDITCLVSDSNIADYSIESNKFVYYSYVENCGEQSFIVVVQ